MSVPASEEARRRSDALIEALPYLQHFRGQTVVIKYGGSAMEDPDLVHSVLKDIVFLEAVGINPVIVHGGGKAITRKMEESGIKAVFASGLRVTDKASVEIVEKVLTHEINPAIAARINEMGGKARSFSGRDVFRASKLETTDEGGQSVDLGFVGEIDGCRLLRVIECIREEVVPVISPLGMDEAGQVYNVNADTAAAEIAIGLEASKVIFLSDVNGIMRDPDDAGTRFSSLDPENCRTLISDEVIRGGMIPKVESCLRLLRHGVEKVHLIDGRIPHALLLELFTDRGIGTEIVASAT